MTHIVMMIEYFAPRLGGAEELFVQAVNRLRHRYRISIVTIQYDPDVPAEQERAPQAGSNPVTIYRIPSSRLGFAIRGARFLSGLMRRDPFQLIHSSTFVACVGAGLRGRRHRIPVIVTVHELFGALWHRYQGGVRGRCFRLCEWASMQLPFVRYHAVSTSTANAIHRIAGVHPRLVTVANPGIDVTQRHPRAGVSVLDIPPLLQSLTKKWTDKRRVLGYVGHMGESKGIRDVLLALVQRLPQQTDVAIWINTIWANDAYSQLIKEMILSLQDAGLPIIWTTGLPREQLQCLMRSCDGMIVPSRSEGFGFVAAQASAMHIPLIVSRSSALPETVSGQIVWMTPGDEQSIITSLDRRYSKHYDTQIPYRHRSRDEMVQAWDRMYADVLG